MTVIELPEHGIVGIRANNPSPFSLSGTNSWIVDRDPAWLVDPGPALPDHLDALTAVIVERGGLGAILLTHDHFDHSEAIPAMRERFPGTPVAACRGAVDVLLRDGDELGPLRALATPGHAPDHLVFVTGAAAVTGDASGHAAFAGDAPGPVACTGDAVLGEGSVFIAPDPHALSSYLAALARLRELNLRLLLPGHGPVVEDPEAKLEQYITHRLDRERRLLAALAAGKRSVDELLDDAWSDAPAVLRPAAAVTLAAHLDKLEEEGRLPDGVERPDAYAQMLRAAGGSP